MQPVNRNLSLSECPSMSAWQLCSISDLNAFFSIIFSTLCNIWLAAIKIIPSYTGNQWSRPSSAARLITKRMSGFCPTLLESWSGGSFSTKFKFKQIMPFSIIYNGQIQYIFAEWWSGRLVPNSSTLLSQWFLTPARLRISTTATDRANLDVSSKEGAVIGAVLSARKFHRSHHRHQTYE
jgi:hypothetical protein